jgi:hypothetical protein
MRFELRLNAKGEVEVFFASSKEEFGLGTLSFVDDDGDSRGDVRELLLTVAAASSPFFVVVRGDR